MVVAELQKLAIELGTKVEKLKTEKEDESEHQKVRLWNEDLLRIIGGNGNVNSIICFLGSEMEMVF